MVFLNLKNVILFMIFFINSFLFSYFIINMSMVDDGLRHIGLIYENYQSSWNNIFINSLFSEYSISLWFFWEKLLFYLSFFIDKDMIHIYINQMIYFLLSIYFYLSFKENKYNYYLNILLSLILPILCLRFFNMRPDFFTGLYLIFGIYFIYKDYFKSFIMITLIYSLMYYLSFFHVGFFILLLIVMEKYKKSFYVLLLLIINIIIQFLIYHDFLNIIQNILDTSSRLNINLPSERQSYFSLDFLRNLFGELFAMIFIFIFTFYIAYQLKKKNDYIFILFKSLLLLSPFWILQGRYFFLYQPLFYIIIIYLIYIYPTYFNQSLKNEIFNLINKYKNIIYNSLSIFIVTLFVLHIVIINIYNYQYSNDIKDKYKELKEFNLSNKVIFSNTLNSLNYYILYYFKNVKMIPSCEMSWYQGNYIQEYENILTFKSSLEETLQFGKNHQADIIIINLNLIHYNKNYIDYQKLEKKLNYQLIYIYNNNNLFFQKINNKE